MEKHVGEMNPHELYDTSMDPNNRQLVRLTYTDYENALDKFKVIHGSKQKDLFARKELMKLFKLDKEDIDN
ncbi:MAG: hypothetical protein ACRCXT_08005 [Paraclostridium sp.]